MAPKPRFGVDLDGCVYSFDHGCRTVLQLRGNDIEVRESNYWNEISSEVSEAEWKWVWNEGVREVFQASPPYPGAIKALRRMQDKVDLCIITHRPLIVADITLGKLAEAGIRPYAVIHAHHQKSTVMPECIGYVEDRVENVLDLATHGVPVFVPRRPHNSDMYFPAHQLHIRPFDDWSEVETWVKTFA